MFFTGIQLFGCQSDCGALTTFSGQRVSGLLYSPTKRARVLRVNNCFTLIANSTLEEKL